MRGCVRCSSCLTNPDAPLNDHAVEVRHGDTTIRVMPIIFSGLPPDDAIRSGRLSKILQLALLDVATDELVPLQRTDYLDRVARNTKYVIHPEEAMADHFSLLVLRAAGVLTTPLSAPEDVDRLQELLGYSNAPVSSVVVPIRVIASMIRTLSVSPTARSGS